MPPATWEGAAVTRVGDLPGRGFSLISAVIAGNCHEPRELHFPTTGDLSRTNTVTSVTQGSNCPTDPAGTATVDVLVPAQTITKSANLSTVVAGAAVSYPIAITNSGQSAYTGTTVTDSLAGVVDDATFNNDAVATAGVVGYDEPNLTRSGDLAGRRQRRGARSPAVVAHAGDR